jgi:hypothetical protein
MREGFAKSGIWRAAVGGVRGRGSMHAKDGRWRGVPKAGGM